MRMKKRMKMMKIMEKKMNDGSQRTKKKKKKKKHPFEPVQHQSVELLRHTHQWPPDRILSP